MKCIEHNETDAVTNCADCNAGLCKSCAEKSYYTVKNQPLCNKCNTESIKKEIEKRKVNVQASSLYFFASLVPIILALIYIISKSQNFIPILAVNDFWVILGILGLAYPIKSLLGPKPVPTGNITITVTVRNHQMAIFDLIVFIIKQAVLWIWNGVTLPFRLLGIFPERQNEITKIAKLTEDLKNIYGISVSP